MHFACHDYDLKELVMCTFDISNREFLILDNIITNPSSSAESIARKLELDRSTVQKSLSRLIERKLIQRKQSNLSKGGYKFQYYIPNKTELKKEMLKIIEVWYDGVVVAVQKW